MIPVLTGSASWYKTTVHLSVKNFRLKTDKLVKFVSYSKKLYFNLLPGTKDIDFYDLPVLRDIR